MSGPDDIAAHWSLQRASGSVAEEGGQNKLDNYTPAKGSMQISRQMEIKFDYVN